MNPIEKGLRQVDGFQRRHRPVAFAFAVNKKFGDDTAGNLAALITYYGFLSLFPLLLVVVTVLAMVAGAHSSIAYDVKNSALKEFPVIGQTIGKNIKALHRNSTFGLAVGIVGLIWGAQGIVQIGQMAMANVWNVPRVERPGFLPRLGRSAAMLGVAGLFLMASTAAAGFAAFAPSVARSVPGVVSALSIVASLLLNLALYWFSFRILTPKSVPKRQLLPGALVGGTAWTALQYFGTLLLDHQRTDNAIYGVFGIVLGLMAWIFLGARVTLYAAEINVVHARKLWPRSLMQPPLTEADEAVYADLGRQARYRKELRVDVSMAEPQPTPADGPEPEPAPAPAAAGGDP